MYVCVCVCREEEYEPSALDQKKTQAVKKEAYQFGEQNMRFGGGGGRGLKFRICDGAADAPHESWKKERKKERKNWRRKEQMGCCRLLASSFLLPSPLFRILVAGKRGKKLRFGLDLCERDSNRVKTEWQ
jgi:hypothetical protein